MGSPQHRGRWKLRSRPVPFRKGCYLGVQGCCPAPPRVSWCHNRLQDIYVCTRYATMLWERPRSPMRTRYSNIPPKLSRRRQSDDRDVHRGTLGHAARACFVTGTRVWVHVGRVLIGTPVVAQVPAMGAVVTAVQMCAHTGAHALVHMRCSISSLGDSGRVAHRLEHGLVPPPDLGVVHEVVERVGAGNGPDHAKHGEVGQVGGGPAVEGLVPDRARPVRSVLSRE